MAHEKAKKIARERYQGCIFTGLPDTTGAHIFPVSTFPQLADEPDNIVPMIARVHYEAMPCFDYTAPDIRRPVGEKLWLLNAHGAMVTNEKRVMAMQLLRLMDVCETKGVQYPKGKKPSDLEKLFYSGRLC